MRGFLRMSGKASLRIGLTTCFIFCIWSFAICGLSNPVWAVSPGVSQFLEIVNSFPINTCFEFQPTDPQPIPKPPPLLSSHTPGHYLPALVTPGPGMRHLGTVPMLQSPLNYSSQPILILLLLSQVCPVETTDRLLPAVPSPTSSLARLFSHVTQDGLPCPLLFVAVSSKLSFPWQLFSNLLALLYLTFSINILYVKTEGVTSDRETWMKHRVRCEAIWKRTFHVERTACGLVFVWETASWPCGQSSVSQGEDFRK